MPALLVFPVFFLLGLLLTFLVHELGHLVVARTAGVHVGEASFGFGPLVWSRVDRHGTRWCLHLYPFGAHVQLTNPEARPGRDFASRGLGTRLPIVGAGVVANLVFAAILFTAFYATVGQPATPTVLTGIEIGGPADLAGMRIADRIIAIDGVHFDRYQDISHYLQTRYDRPLKADLQRDGRSVSVMATPDHAQYHDVKGVYRDHGRFGVLAQQLPLSLEAVAGVDDIRVQSMDQARRLIAARLDQTFLMDTKGTDGKLHRNLVHPHAAENPDLLTPGSKEADVIYLGRERLDHYLPRPPRQAAAAGLQAVSHSVLGLCGLFIKPLPMDREAIQPDDLAGPVLSSWRTLLHRFVNITGLASIWIAVINLTPVPGLDGYLLLRYASEAIIGTARTARLYPYLWRGMVIAAAMVAITVNIVARI